MTAEVGTVGLCENCKKVILMSDYAGAEGSEVWLCKHCRKAISHLSFGYDKGTTGAKKVLWVGPKGKWVSEKPSKEFTVGVLKVYPKPLPLWMSMS